MNDLEKEMQFNPLIHQSTPLGDPAREDDGTIKLKKDWEKVAVDRQGRKFNPKIHGKKQVVDDEGYLTLIKRDQVNYSGNTSRIRAFVDKHKEPGYAYYLFNDEPGRLEQAHSENWEPVGTKGKGAQMKVGQARDADTSGVLHRKPIEWYEADQEEKRRRNNDIQEDTSTPKEALGQYRATEQTPLR